MDWRISISCLFSLLFCYCVIMEIGRRTSSENISNIPVIKKDPVNIIFILTDDQDSVLGSMKVMRNVDNLLTKKGRTFSQTFVTSPLCCPSRSSILTGLYVHNHKAINNSITGGCSSASWQGGPERNTFATHLNNNGYSTFFAGKYLNQYGRFGKTSHIPLGWDQWYGLVGNSRYYDYTLSENGIAKYYGNDSTDYLTNVIRTKGIEFITKAAKQSQPFFVMLSTPACHAPFEAESKYIDVFKGSKAPRTPNFNSVNDQSKHWLLRLGEQPLSQDIIDKVDDVYGKRLATLLTVDDMIGDIYSTVEKNNLINSTYFIFASDNGYHLGQFSLPLDKREPYEFDIKVPLVISGPDVSHGVSDNPVSSVDIAPTILKLAGVKIPKNFDGYPLNLNSERIEEDLHVQKRKRKSVFIEHSGEGVNVNNGCEYLGAHLSGCNPEFGCKCEDSSNNTYVCLRHLDEGKNFVYCAWEDEENFEEYYDIEIDPFELNNTVKDLDYTYRSTLRMILQAFQSCTGNYCRNLSKFIF